jgi:hypothetical protein
VIEQLRIWLASRAPRERALLAAVAGVGGVAVLLAAALAIHTDLAALEERVASHERELVALRRLASSLGPTPAPAPAGSPSLVTRLETAAEAVVGRPRIAAMTPTTTPLPEGLREERVALRLAGTSLAELVRLLHGLGSADPPIEVARLELRKHPDDPRHFDVTIEVARVLPESHP